jgi:hypothetical protein
MDVTDNGMSTQRMNEVDRGATLCHWLLASCDVNFRVHIGLIDIVDGCYRQWNVHLLSLGGDNSLRFVIAFYTSTHSSLWTCSPCPIKQHETLNIRGVIQGVISWHAYTCI